MFKIVSPISSKYVNFSNPVRGRKWLQTLKPNKRFGITFLPNLDLSSDILGFSFRSNKFGLRGSALVDVPGVIAGTSFAMGLSVDEGDNWYDIILNKNSWFNSSMPVGISNNINVIEDLYKGDADTLIYLYHPNIWRISECYTSASSLGINIFEAQGWKTGNFSMVTMYPRWVFKECVKWSIGKSLYCDWNGTVFHLNATYNFFDHRDPKRAQFVVSQMKLLNNLFKKFKKIIVIRVPIKEDSMPTDAKSEALIPLRKNYDKLWSLFKGLVDSKVKCVALDHEEFSSEHFHPYDTHWNKKGNELFASRIKDILVKSGVDGLID